MAMRKQIEMNDGTAAEAEVKKPIITDLEDLPGVGSITAEKLREAGFDSFMSIAVMPNSQLAELTGMTDAGAAKVITAARAALEMDFITGEDIMRRHSEITKISTGSKELDKLIGGGVESQGITEAAAEFSSGKTQLGFQLAINVQKPIEQGGLNAMALYIDSEGTFRPERVRQMAELQGMDPDKVLKNIMVARAFSSDHQMLLAEKAGELIQQKKLPIKLIVVDSLMALFRSEYTGRGMLSDRQQKINRHMHLLQRLSDTHNLAIYVTNQVMSRPDIFFGNPTAAIGGHIVGHTCLTGDTLVQLGDGTIKQIKDVQQDNFLSVNFKNMKLEKSYSDAKSENNNIKTIYEIETTNRIKASPMHRFFKLNNLEVEEVHAEALKKGDWLLHASQMDVGGELQPLPEIEVDEFITLSPVGAELIKNSCYDNNILRRDLCKNIGITPRQFRRVLNQSYPTNLSVINNLTAINISDDSIYDYIEPFESYKHRRIQIPTTFNAEFANVYGYFIGDGNLEERSIRFTDSRKEVLIHYQNLMENLFDINSDIKPVKGKNCFRLHVNSIHAKKLFESLRENIIEVVSKSPKPIISAFIKGFADAEGHISKRDPILTIAQKDLQIIKAIQMLLLRFGIRSSIWDGKNAYHLLIVGRDIIQFNNEIGLTAEDKSQILNKWVKHCEHTHTRELYPIDRKLIWNMLRDSNLKPSRYMRSRPGLYKHIHKNELLKAAEALFETKYKQKAEFILKLVNGDVCVEKIRKIKKLPNNELLYDISVPGNENYIANGIIVHNSKFRLFLRKSKGDKRIARLIDSPCLPEGEAVFRVTAKGIEDA